MKRVHSGLPSLLDGGRRWVSLVLAIMAAAWRVVTWPFSAAAWFGAWLINACLRVAVAMLGLLVAGFLLYGVGYVVFYPLIAR